MILFLFFALPAFELDVQGTPARQISACGVFLLKSTSRISEHMAIEFSVHIWLLFLKDGLVSPSGFSFDSPNTSNDRAVHGLRY